MWNHAKSYRTWNECINKIEKMTTAYDLFGNKYQRQLKNFKFRVSVYGILSKGDKVLMQRHPLLKKYGLPGGGIDLGESISSALLREFKEETGLIIKLRKLLDVTEDFFTYEDEDFHSILIFYEVEKAGGKLITMGNQEDTAEVKYIKLTKLSRNNTQRVFWKTIAKLF
ncbi:MAG TPA: NUDIX domain-containing protein [Candidatus Bathyarchaeia archaeon]|nr:NUDIX domain-containing protein [Candidatus Bathyarchaeia archaeon]